MDYFRDIFVFIFEENLGQMDVSHGVLYVPTSKVVLNVKRVFRAPYYHLSSEVAERFEAYVQQPRILEFVGYSLPLFGSCGCDGPSACRALRTFGRHSFEVTPLALL